MGVVKRYDPFSEFRDLRRGFDIINSIMNEVQKNRTNEGVLVDFVPTVNTREDDKAYYVEVDLPGVKKEDVDINVEDNVLTVTGERKQEEETKDKEYYRLESRYGKFSRSFTLPQKVDVNKISAKSEDGVLEIVIPKLKEPEVKPKKIKIK